jgi:hypothetical protein
MAMALYTMGKDAERFSKAIRKISSGRNPPSYEEGQARNENGYRHLSYSLSKSRDTEKHR